MEDLRENVKKCFSRVALARLLGFSYYNGSVARIVQKVIDENQLDISHFDGGKSKHRKTREQRECPICKKVFSVISDSKRKKVTCSYACSNTYFRSGQMNGMKRKADENPNYTRICFQFHKKKCIVCEETNIVSVHHFDGNHTNNDPKNLVPLCPTHHQYVHSHFYVLIKEAIEEYVSSFQKNNGNC